MAVENTRRNTERRIYVQVIIAGRAPVRSSSKNRLDGTYVMTRSQINAATCPRLSTLHVDRVEILFKAHTDRYKTNFPFSA